jgi:sec-independent protein translocase protein TatC
MAPLEGLGIRVYTFNPAEKFAAYLRLSLWAGGIVSAPFLLLQGLLFVWPGLRGQERGYTAAALFAIPALFTAGAGGAYWFLSPKVLGFFLRFGGADGIQPLWGFKEYLGMLCSLMFAAGLLLQAPLLLLLAFITGITTPEAAGRFRPLWVFLIFLAAAVCTPPDVVSQIALGVPLYLLFELTLCIGRALRPRKGVQ